MAFTFSMQNKEGLSCTFHGTKTKYGHTDKYVMTYMAGVIFLVPVLIMSFAYGRTAVVLHRSVAEARRLQSPRLVCQFFKTRI